MRLSRRFDDARRSIEQELEEADPSTLPYLCAELARLSDLAHNLLRARARADEDVAPLDRLLSLEQAAARLGVDERWLRRHQHELPFIRQLSRKELRVSERGLNEWIERAN